MSNGGNQILLGGEADATILRGGIQTVATGGLASGTEVDSGGIDNVQPGGVGRSIVVSSGGAEFVFSGGVATGTSVRSGGTETVEIFGFASATSVSAGGVEVVRFGGTASDTVLLAGATQYVYSGAVVSGTAVRSGGIEVISAGATADGTFIDVGGAIDLPFLLYTVVDRQSSNATGTLTVTEGGDLYQQIWPALTPMFRFGSTPDNGIGTLVTMDSSPPCFVTGTRSRPERVRSRSNI